ncbi:hypothetical protein JMJ56_27855 [Belnapia sp. T18]|uniref:DUF6745 domain-containing protein n=1 Tax=Belnapia arida TaxID=2804533 RepID=A0ABS1UAT6_9PROT|nr:hypothetical protein [Belnapia arida]MBL6081803.1 hypothetical protein [Belnapia arida]
MARPGSRRIAVDNPLGPISTSRTNPTTAAVEDFYSACHLCPPAVLVARDAAHFGRLAAQITRSFGFVEVMGCLMLGMVLLVMLTPPAGDGIAAAYGALMALLLPWFVASRLVHRGNGVVLGEALLRVLLSLLVGAAVIGVARLAGAEHRIAFRAAGLAMGAGVCLQLALLPLVPCFVRWRLRRTVHTGSRLLPWSIILRGARRADAVVTARLASALDDVDQTHGGRGLRGHRGQTQWAMQSAIMEGVQSQSVWSSDIGLVLGQSVGYSTDPAARVGALTSTGIDPASLPRVLRAAGDLDRRAEAVAAFHGVAVVLPAGASPTSTPAAVTLRPNRRSNRLPWREALRWLDNAPGVALAVDLAPSDGLADWILAHRLTWLPEVERRTPAIRVLGVERVVAALRLRPVHEDEYGRLYQVGRREVPSTFVAVRDRVLGADGTPLEHWIAVPPHAATAREAVAWSFGMGETEYQPAREA